MKIADHIESQEITDATEPAGILFPLDDISELQEYFNIYTNES